MMKWIALSALIVIALLSSHVWAARGIFGNDDTLKIGRVSVHPRRHYEQLDRLGEYLVTHLSEQGIKQHQVIIPRDNAEMVEFLRSGKIDLISESPFSALLFEQLADAKILLREWKQGVSTQRALFVTRVDTGIESLADLEGRSIALEDPGSTTSYFVPHLILQQHGLQLVPLNKLRTRTKTVRYSFAGTDVNILYWLARGRVDAGVVSDLDWASQRRTPEGMTQQLKVFHLSEPVIRSLILVRPDLDLLLQQAIENVLLDMVNSEPGQVALQNYFNTARFDRIEGETAVALDAVRTQFQAFYPSPQPF